MTSSQDPINQSPGSLASPIGGLGVTSDNDKSYIQELVEQTRKQTAAELERVSIEKARLEEKRKIRAAEEERNNMLQRLLYDIERLTQIITENIYPDLKDVADRAQLSTELLRMLASNMVGLASDQKASESLKQILLKMSESRAHSGDVVITTHGGQGGNSMSSGSDMNLSAERDISLKG